VPVSSTRRPGYHACEVGHQRDQEGGGQALLRVHGQGHREVGVGHQRPRHELVPGDLAQGGQDPRVDLPDAGHRAREPGLVLYQADHQGPAGGEVGRGGPGTRVARGRRLGREGAAAAAEVEPGAGGAEADGAA